MNDAEYKSVLAPFMLQLIEMERASGAENRNLYWMLREFDNFAEECGLTAPYVTERFITEWRKSRVNDSERSISNKISAWRKLLSLMNRRGCKCFVPRPARAPKSTFVPYIFTQEELSAIWKTIDGWKLFHNYGSSALISYPSLFRLLYSTGLRVGEVLSIKNKDINLSESTILIHATKSASERVVVLHESTRKVLKSYISHRDKMPVLGISSPDRHLFVKLDGTPVTPAMVYDHFRSVLKKCGIKYGGRSRGPCVHSLRHTYAVHSLANMTRGGMNIYAALPILSASMGHHSLAATEYYVRLTRATYDDIERNSSALNAYVYPDISRYHENED